MKKFLKIFIFVLLINISTVKAADFNASISGTTNVTNGTTYTYSFKASSSADIAGISGTIDYDKNKLELVSSNASSSFEINLNKSTGVFNARYDAGKTGTFTYMQVKFKVKSMDIGDSTTITINNLKGTKIVDSSAVSATGTASKITLQVKSDDNNLVDLTIDGKTISGFKSSVVNYKMTVENSTSKVLIGAKLSDSKATIKGTGTKSLNVYNNTVKVVVTAQNGKTKTYTIAVIRKDSNGYAGARSNDGSLKEIKIENYEIDFDSATKLYELEVENNVSSLNISAIANDSNAKVEIPNASLNVGENSIVIKVIAEDESITEYYLSVTRKNDNPLVTIDKFLDASSNTTKDTIEILLEKDQIISSSELEMIKNSQKNVILSYYEDNKLIYAWHLKNDDIIVNEEFNTSVKFVSSNKNEIEKLTNYAESYYISTNNINKSNVKLKVFVNIENKISNLYYYENNKIALQDSVEINECYIEIPHKHYEYFISRMEVKKISVWGILFGVENGVIALVCLYLVIRTIKKEKMYEKKD